MLPNAPPDRWTIPDACRRIEREFDLPYDIYNQDWEYTLSDPSLTDVFIAKYDIRDPDTDYRFALAAIAIDSADQALSNGTLADSTLNRLRQILTDDSEVLMYLIHYWCIFGATNDEEYFPISPFFRSVWNAITGDTIPLTMPPRCG